MYKSLTMTPIIKTRQMLSFGLFLAYALGLIHLVTWASGFSGCATSGVAIQKHSCYVKGTFRADGRTKVRELTGVIDVRKTEGECGNVVCE